MGLDFLTAQRLPYVEPGSMHKLATKPVEARASFRGMPIVVFSPSRSGVLVLPWTLLTELIGVHLSCRLAISP